MSNYKELCLKLFNAEGMEGVKSIIDESELLKNSDNWKPYGGNEGNFSTIQNQQPHPVSALSERIINSIDAILIKECRLKGIDPESEEAPRSMQDAVKNFFALDKGNLELLTSKDRREMAKNIQIIVTGSKDIPDISIYDNGEGQAPQNFDDTFLSLNKGNKNSIYFVQGQFNMGSTGTIMFCKEPHYQLIISRQYAKDEYGFTLVRKHFITSKDKKRKNTWFEYFYPREILSFKSEPLKLNLYENKPFETGTIVKLFSYKLGFKGTARLQLNSQLNQLLYRPALPFLLIERRNYTKKDDREALGIYGNGVRLFNEKNQVEKKYQKSIEDKNIKRITIDVILLKKGDNKKQDDDRVKNYIGKNRSVVFTMNGQVHATEKPLVLKKMFSYIHKHLLIHVDCSDLDQNFRSSLFMADRSGFREGESKTQLFEKLEATLKSDETLKTLNNKRREEYLNQEATDKDSLINDILKKREMSSELKKILKNRKGLLFDKKQPRNAKNKKNKNKEKKIKLERFPSIFKIDLKEKNGKRIKRIPLGDKRMIKFETNVQDDYFYRPEEKGSLKLKILDYKRNESNNNNSGLKPNESNNNNSDLKPNEVTDVFEVERDHTDHNIKIVFKPRDDVVKVGDEIKINAKLTSPDGDIDVPFYIGIDARKKHNMNKPNKQQDEELQLPTLITVKKNDGEWILEKGDFWTEKPVDWDENSIITVSEHEGEIDSVTINMDSHILNQYYSSQKANTDKKIESCKNKYIALVYLHSIILFNSMEQVKDIDRSECVAKIFKSYIKALLYVDASTNIHIED